MPSKHPRRLLLLPLQALIGLAVALDELARPLYRPLATWFAGLRPVERVGAAIARLPPYLALATLAVPFAIAEPVKLIGLVLLARGAFTAGLVVSAAGHLLSFLLVERVYHAAKPALFSIPWFARLMGFVTSIREAVLARLRAVSLYRRIADASRRFALRTKVRLARLRARRGR